jgi:hypothetical protein
MSSGRLVYPRLPRPIAEDELYAIVDVGVEDLGGRSRLSHSLATFAPTGGSRATESKLEEVRDLVYGLATDAGYPTDGSDATRTAFDRQCAMELYRTMEIVPADAAAPGVWAFLGCVVLPDFVTWRFPRKTPERFLGGHRNAFRRLWWRAYVLGVGDGEDSLVRSLAEDEVVQIMERPTLGGNPRVARSLARSFLRALENTSAGRMELMREAAKRLLRLTPIVSLDALDDSSLADVTDEVVSGALEALGQPEPIAARSSSAGVLTRTESVRAMAGVPRRFWDNAAPASARGAANTAEGDTDALSTAIEDDLRDLGFGAAGADASADGQTGSSRERSSDSV